MLQSQSSVRAVEDTADEKAELSALGITVCDQTTLEKNVQKKVDTALAEHEEKQKLNILERELRQVTADIEAAHKNAANLDIRFQGMHSRIADPKHYINTEAEVIKQNNNIDALNQRLVEIRRELDADTGILQCDAEEGEIVSDEESEEAERDRLIREGEITPFLALAATAVCNVKINENKPCRGYLDGNDSKSATGKLETSVQLTNYTGRPVHLHERKIVTAVKTPSIHSSADEEKLMSCKKAQQKSSNELLPAEAHGLSRYFADQLQRQQQHHPQRPSHPAPVLPSSLYHLSDLKKKKKGKKIKHLSVDLVEENIAKGSLGSVKRRWKTGIESVGKVPAVSQLDKQTNDSPLLKSLLQPKKRPKLLNVGTVISYKECDKNRQPGKLLSETTAFEDHEASDDQGSEYLPSDASDSTDCLTGDELQFEKKVRVEWKKSGKASGTVKRKTKDAHKRSPALKKNHKDDSNVKSYQRRLQKLKTAKLEAKLKRLEAQQSNGDEGGSISEEDDGFEHLGVGLMVPNSVWRRLYRYQCTGVRWLCELHQRGCGGILGDEMGLGKTVQMIAFLAGLRCGGVTPGEWRRGGRGLGPVLVVCPATLMHQWLRHFHDWWPPFRVAILHSSGGYSGNCELLMHNICKDSGVLITSYTGARDKLESLLKFSWHYVILDEGHKIRNPDAQITLALKKFNTPHRLILSGSPIQNSLKELWSLFDFVFPGKLGTLQVFLQQFAVPITQGGYANASRVEVETAFKCAVVLRDTINPYLLRRIKADVRSHLTLPEKSEQVLFCGLTDEQRSLYKSYIAGDQVSNIMRGRMKVFVGLINLRKLCNHPDLYTGGTRLYAGETVDDLPQSSTYGWWERSGKMQVVHGVLQLWQRQQHRTLLFTQSAQMLAILENFLKQQGYSYLKMNGKTPVSGRHALVQRFNTDSSIFVFLLTTKVGGLGVNLTGADRVLIYDPDWNPSTDTQAKERAWRIGQLRNVTIYRLLTAGTIEEKIYHRQIFKQFLTNRVLKDPKQQRFFKTNDLYELFTLNEGKEEKTESSALFAGLGSDISLHTMAERHRDSSEDEGRPRVTEERRRRRRNDKERGKGKEAIVAKRLALKQKIDKVNNIESFSKEALKDVTKRVASSLAADGLETHAAVSNNSVNFKCIEVKSVKINQAELKLINGNFNENEDFVSNEVTDELASKADLADLSGFQTEKQEFVLCNSNSCSVENIHRNPSIDISADDHFEQNSNCISGRSNTGMDVVREVEGSATVKTVKLYIDSGATVIMKPELECDTVSNVAAYSPAVTTKEIDHKTEKMRLLARMLSQKIASGSTSSVNKSSKKMVSEKCNKYGSDKKDAASLNYTKKNKCAKNKPEKRWKKFEGERIDFLVKKRKRRDDESKVEVEKDKSQNEYVLSKLFKSSGVHTVMSHDAIINSSDADYLLLEAEADRVAKDAMRIVRASRAQCFRPRLSSSINQEHRKKAFETQLHSRFASQLTKGKDESSSTNSAAEGDSYSVLSSSTSSNTFTGAGKCGMMTSAQLLQRMRQRNALVLPAAPVSPHDDSDDSSDAVPVGGDVNPTTAGNVDLLSDIRNFVAFQAAVDGRASTQEIVDRFRDRLPKDKTHIFKALLKEICNFKKDGCSMGMWSIKQEFR